LEWAQKAATTPTSNGDEESRRRLEDRGKAAKEFEEVKEERGKKEQEVTTPMRCSISPWVHGWWQ
jgi:hypothetical protein